MLRMMTAAALLLAALPATAHASELRATLDAFKAFAQEHRVKNPVPSMSYAIIEGGKIIADEAFGWQDHDSEEPTTTDTTSHPSAKPSPARPC